MNKEEILKLVDELALSDEIKLSDIPDINLYITQVESFLSDKLGHHKRSPKDKILTPTMINNYAKDNLLMRPTKGKQYTKEHIVLMILLYYLKQILSLDDIGKMFKEVLKDMSTTDDDVIPLEEIYSIFVDLKQDEYKNFHNTILKNLEDIQEKTKNINSENPEEFEEDKEKAEWFLIVIMLVAQAHAQKRLAERIIDNYFS